MGKVGPDGGPTRGMPLPGSPPRQRVVDREHDGCAGGHQPAHDRPQHNESELVGRQRVEVIVVRRGRERLRYLNPAPIHEIEERWISDFDKPRLQAITTIKNQAEEFSMTTGGASVPTYGHVTSDQG